MCTCAGYKVHIVNVVIQEMTSVYLIVSVSLLQHVKVTTYSPQHLTLNSRQENVDPVKHYNGK